MILQICYDHGAKNTAHNFCNQTEEGDCAVRLSKVIKVITDLDRACEDRERSAVKQEQPRRNWRWKRHLQVLAGAVDKQKTGAYITLLCDRELHAALRKAGCEAEWAFFRIFADGHEAFDMAGLTVQERTWRLYKVTFMLTCLFGDRFEVRELTV